MTGLPQVGQSSVALSSSQERVLWQLAQHKYGWGYVVGIGNLSAARALVRRGLASEAEFDHRFTLTGAGEDEVKARWPKSPTALHCYALPEGGWDLLEAR